MMRCPFCHAGIETSPGGAGDASPAVPAFRCKRCQAPHHAACWQDHGGRCSVYGCRSTEHVPLTRLATPRIVLAAGKQAIGGAFASARERLGGKSVVALFLLSCLVGGLGLAPFLYHVHASRKVEVEIVLAALFVILATWIAGLLYRGAELHHDLDVGVGQRDLRDYYFFAPSRSGGGGNSLSGCDLGGCGGSSDLDGLIGAVIIGVLALIVIFIVVPIVAWVAVEVLLPCVVLAVYGALYGALAFAVNKQEALAGKLIPCIRRAVFYAGIYTALVGTLIAVAFKVFHLNAVPR